MNLNSAKQIAHDQFQDELKKMCELLDLPYPTKDGDILDNRFFTNGESYMFFINEDFGFAEIIAESLYFTDAIMIINTGHEPCILSQTFRYDMETAKEHFCNTVNRFSRPCGRI